MCSYSDSMLPLKTMVTQKRHWGCRYPHGKRHFWERPVSGRCTVPPDDCAANCWPAQCPRRTSAFAVATGDKTCKVCGGDAGWRRHYCGHSCYCWQASELKNALVMREQAPAAGHVTRSQRQLPPIPQPQPQNSSPRKTSVDIDDSLSK